MSSTDVMPAPILNHKVEKSVLYFMPLAGGNLVKTIERLEKIHGSLDFTVERILKTQKCRVSVFKYEVKPCDWNTEEKQRLFKDKKIGSEVLRISLLNRSYSFDIKELLKETSIFLGEEVVEIYQFSPKDYSGILREIKEFFLFSKILLKGREYEPLSVFLNLITYRKFDIEKLERYGVGKDFYALDIRYPISKTKEVSVLLEKLVAKVETVSIEA